MDVIAAVVWHWWIALALVLGAVPAVIGTIVGYVVKVEQCEAQRWPTMSNRAVVEIGSER